MTPAPAKQGWRERRRARFDNVFGTEVLAAYIWMVDVYKVNGLLPTDVSLTDLLSFHDKLLVDAIRRAKGSRFPASRWWNELSTDGKQKLYGAAMAELLQRGYGSRLEDLGPGALAAPFKKFEAGSISW